MSHFFIIVGTTFEIRLKLFNEIILSEVTLAQCQVRNCGFETDRHVHAINGSCNT